MNTTFCRQLLHREFLLFQNSCSALVNVSVLAKILLKSATSRNVQLLEIDRIHPKSRCCASHIKPAWPNPSKETRKEDRSQVCDEMFTNQIRVAVLSMKPLRPREPALVDRESSVSRSQRCWFLSIRLPAPLRLASYI